MWKDLPHRSAADAIKFTVDASYMKKPELEEVAAVAAAAVGSGPPKDGFAVANSQAVPALSLTAEEAYAQMACSLDNPEACEACGS